jgi:hypothetical protein
MGAFQLRSLSYDVSPHASCSTFHTPYLPDPGEQGNSRDLEVYSWARIVDWQAKCTLRSVKSLVVLIN